MGADGKQDRRTSIAARAKRLLGKARDAMRRKRRDPPRNADPPPPEREAKAGIERWLSSPGLRRPK